MIIHPVKLPARSCVIYMACANELFDSVWSCLMRRPIGVYWRIMDLAFLKWRPHGFLLDPNIAYLLLMAAILFVLLAIATPGTGVPELIAFFALVLAGYAVYHLSFNWWALAAPCSRA